MTISSTVEKRLLKLEEKMEMLRDNSVHASNLTEQLVLSLTRETHERESAFLNLTSVVKTVKKSLHEAMKNEINAISTASDEKFATMNSALTLKDATHNNEAKQAMDLIMELAEAQHHQKKWVEEELRGVQSTVNDRVLVVQAEITQSTTQEVASLRQSVARDGKGHVEAIKQQWNALHKLEQQVSQDRSDRANEMQEMQRDNTAIRERVDKMTERIATEEQQRSNAQVAMLKRIDQAHQEIGQCVEAAQITEKATRSEFAQAQEQLKHTIHDALKVLQSDMDKQDKTVGAINAELASSRKDIGTLQDTVVAVRSDVDDVREAGNSNLATLTQALHQHVDMAVNIVRADLGDIIQTARAETQQINAAFHEELTKDRAALVALDHLQTKDISNAKKLFVEEMDSLRSCVGDDMRDWEKTTRERYANMDATSREVKEYLDELKAEIKIVAALVEHSVVDDDFQETVDSLRSTMRADITKVADELQHFAAAHKQVASTFSQQQSEVAKITQEQETTERRWRTLSQEIHNASTEHAANLGEQKKSLQGMHDQLKALQSNVTLQIVPNLAQCTSQIEGAMIEQKSTLDEIATLRDELNDHRHASKRGLQECESSIKAYTVDAAEREDPLAALRKIASNMESLGALVDDNRMEFDMFRKSECVAFRNELQKCMQTQEQEWSVVARRLEAEMARIRDTVEKQDLYKRWDESKVAFVTKELADARRRDSECSFRAAHPDQSSPRVSVKPSDAYLTSD